MPPICAEAEPINDAINKTAEAAVCMIVLDAPR
jgi:hypothetical protein